MNTVSYHGRQSDHFRRHGVSTLYALIYVTLAAGVMAATGQLLHSVMRASDVDRRLIQELQMTQLVASRLRDDTASAASTTSTDVQHLNVEHDGGTIEWSVKDHLLMRTQYHEQELKSRNRFRFRHGTQLQFNQQEQQIGRLRIIPPPLAWLPSAPTDSISGDRYVDIILAFNESAD